MWRYAFFAVVLVLLGAGGAAFVDKTFLQKSAGKSDKMVEMRYRRLGNGTMVYEEIPGQSEIQDIEPAAGADAQGAEPRYKYDPLTQTYRVQTVDTEGNKSEDIFNTPQ